MAITGHKAKGNIFGYAGSNARPEVADAAMDKARLTEALG